MARQKKQKQVVQPAAHGDAIISTAEGYGTERQIKLDKQSFKKVYKSECSAEFADSDYAFLWRGKKYNCRRRKK